LLVTNSGTDYIVELDLDGRPLWDMLLFEHGDYPSNARFRRAFDRRQSYNGAYIPSTINLHVNSARLMNSDTILATLFGPGQLVRIDRRSREIEVVLADLKRPHAVRCRADGGYLLSNSDAQEIVMLDADLRVQRRMAIPAPWIQDALIHDNRVFALGNRRIFEGGTAAELRDDAAATNRALELDLDGVVRRTLDVGPEHRLYTLDVLSEVHARAWAEAWAAQSVDTSWLRWRVGPDDASLASRRSRP
jgi:hypothetical protein